MAFMVISSKIHKNILGLYPSIQHPDDTPILLPAEAITLLSCSCDISEDLVEVCWTVMQDMVWKSDDIWDCISDDRAVKSSQKNLWPPTLNKRHLKLSGLKEWHAILYTKADGPVPVMKYHLQKKAQHYYYSCDPIPNILQLSKHSFAETSLIRMWQSNMLHAHFSVLATKYAKIYLTAQPSSYSDRLEKKGKAVKEIFAVATFQLKKQWEWAVVEGDEAQHLEEEELDTGSEVVFEAMVDSSKGKGEKKVHVHFKCKHKESNGYCAKHCNPYQFKEMLYVDENGKEQWFFNTLIVEQTNAWFGQYHSMC
ncbi:hypothetical protein BT96DRAFT_976284 [Gymnopus androsaceus JB14]|uniref:CxC5 like cysteine cluster associated with KDZ domain-containing protein n=1 Tax=Gymnopus androsaceus JB14 TaxID=1447944 RepID=A0A6A4HIP9_9AGAR|nr:hypothetical protein BT96DRAFT_976284 [Gymnopus androsaceus JB14]